MRKRRRYRVVFIAISLLAFLLVPGILYWWFFHYKRFDVRFTDFKTGVETSFSDNVMQTEILALRRNHPTGRIQVSRNGKPVSDTLVRDGLTDGEETIWWGNGNIYWIHHYQNGCEHGIQESFWPNGKRMSYCMKKNGHPVGTSIVWYENGQTNTISNTDSNGCPDGWSFEYWPDGSLISAGLSTNHGFQQDSHSSVCFSKLLRLHAGREIQIVPS